MRDTASCRSAQLKELSFEYADWKMRPTWNLYYPATVVTQWNFEEEKSRKINTRSEGE